MSKYIGPHLTLEEGKPPDTAAQRDTAPLHVPVKTEQLAPPASIEAYPKPSYPYRDTQEIRIYTLGQFRVERKIGTVWQVCESSAWHRRRARSLLGCLLSSPGHRLGRDEVIQVLWAGLDQDAAANRLHGAVHELRLLFEPELVRVASSRLLRQESDSLELAGQDKVWVDADAFEARLKDARGVAHPRLAERILEEAAALYGGTYIQEELYAEWAAPRRESLRRGWTDLLFTLSHLRAERDDLLGAIQALDRLRATDPADETAVQQLMVLLMRLNRRGEALQVYRQHVLRLRREEEGEPLPETRALYRSLRQGRVPDSYVVGEIPYTPPQRPIDPPTEGAKKRGGAGTLLARGTNAAETQEVPFRRPALHPDRTPRGPFVGREQERDAMGQAMRSLEGAITLTANALSAPPGASPPNERDAPLSGAARTNKNSAPGCQSPLHGGQRPVRPPHFVLLSGEPGIGKTRLAEEVSREAHTRGWAVAWGRAHPPEEGGTATPYHPWITLLHTLLKGVDLVSPRGTSADQTLARRAPGADAAENLASILTRLSAVLPVYGRQDRGALPPSPTPPPAEQTPLHIWEATLGLLSVLSRTHPLLLVLDDLQWADEESLRLLTYLARHFDSQRVLLVATCRDGELSTAGRSRVLLTNLRREQVMTVLEIGPLAPSQVGTLVASVSDRLSEDTRRQILSQAAGNPLFAEELARSWGQDAPADVAVPVAIAAVLEHCLGWVSSACQWLLREAAALGDVFTLNQLRVQIGGAYDDEDILTLIEEALEARLLVEEDTGAMIRYAFAHPLLASHLCRRVLSKIKIPRT